MFTVDDGELRQIFYAFHPFSFRFLDGEVGIPQVGDHLEVSLLMSLIFFLEIVEDISHSQSHA